MFLLLKARVGVRRFGRASVVVWYEADHGVHAVIPMKSASDLLSLG